MLDDAMQIEDAAEQNKHKKMSALKKTGRRRCKIWRDRRKRMPDL
jgi:hypothetical protein